MSSKNNLIINCAATHVSVAEFGVSSGKLVLENFKMQELNYDYSSQEKWLDALRAALKQLGVKGKAVVIAPSMLLLAKVIKIPHVEPSRQKEVVTFEVSKNIPYPISEVSWSYQVVADDGVETTIFLVSMKSSDADEFCAALSSVGVVPVAIDASSLLEYNTWKYCGLEDNAVILNVGARFTNLMVARADGMFVRSFPLGGNVLTQSIADSLGKSFESSEEYKRNFFASASAAGAAGSERFTDAAKNVMVRISQEVKRSLLNYRRTDKVAAPAKVYLTGRASQLPGFAQFLAEDLKMSVENLDCSANFAVSPKINQAVVSACSSQFGEILGEAVRRVDSTAFGVNLLPTRIIEDAAFAAKRPLMIAGAALLFAAAVPPFMVFSSQIAENKAGIAKIGENITVLQDRADEFASNKTLAESVSKKISGLEGLAESKSNWINLFIDIERRLNEQKDVWLDNLKVVRDAKSKKYDLELTGRLLIREFNPEDPTAYDPKLATERMTKLLESFKSSEFITDFSNVRTDSSNPRILKFDFTLKVNPAKPI